MRNCTPPFQNYLHNRMLRPDECCVLQNGVWCCAVDEDGFIVDQHLLESFRMGLVTTPRFGCGWVACFNALKLLGHPQSAARTIRALENGFVLGGALGTHAAWVTSFFVRKGFSVRCTVTDAAIAHTASAAKANIVFYLRRPGKGAHFVAFTPAQSYQNGVPLYRFYNSLSVPYGRCKSPTEKCGIYSCAGGSAGDVRTLAQLLAPEQAVCKLVLSIF